MTKTAVVTGASKGIGQQIAKALLAEGYEVFGLCRTQGQNDQIHWVNCDLSDYESIINAAKTVLQQQESIDLLINNAGMGISGAIEFAQREEIERQLDINLNGSIYLTQQFIPVFRKQRSGRIVFTSSLAAIFPIPYQGFYSVSKFGLNAFSDALGIELKQFGVQCCTMMLNDVKSEFTANRIKNIKGNEEYNGRIEASVHKMEESEQSGMPAETVARTLVRLTKRSSLPPHYIVGFSGKCFNILYRLLPAQVLLWLLGLIYG